MEDGFCVGVFLPIIIMFWFGFNRLLAPDKNINSVFNDDRDVS